MKTRDDALGDLHLSQQDRADLIRTVRDIRCAGTWRTRDLATRRALDLLYPRTKPQCPVVPIELLAPSAEEG